ncbi:MAG: hypothetical protein ACLPXB_05385 [Thiobacillaceae bacterium]
MAAVILGLRWHLVQKIRRWGWNRTLGLALAGVAALLGLAGEHYRAVPLAKLRDRLAVQQTQTRPVPEEPQIVALKDLPPASRVIANLTSLQVLVKKRGLTQESGQYKLEREGGLIRYRLNLPVTGSYPEVRRFLSEALADFPNLSLDGVRINREEIGMSEVDAALQLSLYFKQ